MPPDAHVVDLQRKKARGGAAERVDGSMVRGKSAPGFCRKDDAGLTAGPWPPRAKQAAAAVSSR